ncbi:MAG: hypothetical protein AAF716_03775 [Cyanobacteria bacterium P01_D01_bin.1]
MVSTSNEQQSEQQNINQAEGDKELSLDDIAAMVGYRPVDQQISPHLASAEIEDTVEAQDEEESTLDLDLSTTKTKRRLHENPLAKLGLISGAMGVLFFGIGYFLVSTSGFGQRQSAKVSEPAPTEETLSPEAAALADRERELGELKTANALGNQSQALEYQQRQESTLSARPRPAPPSEEVEPSGSQPDSPSTSASPIPPTVRSVSQVQQRPVRPPVRPAQPVQPASSLAAPSARPVESSNISEASAIDPQARWAELAALGSYGSIDYQSAAALGIELEAEEFDNGRDITASYEPVAVFVSSKSVEDISQAEDASDKEEFLTEAPAVSEATQLSDAQQMQSDIDALLGVREVVSDAVFNEPYRVFPGERTSGRLLTPVVYSEDAGVSQEVVLELAEDLMTGDQVALSVGTQVVATVNSVDASGLVTLQVESVVLPADSAYTDISLNPSSLQIRGADGEPLIASPYRGDEREMRDLELDAALIGALGGIGRVLTQPDSESTAIGPGGSISTTSNGNPNILGGILDGAAQAVIAPRQERLRQEAAEISQRPNVWYVPAGREIEVLVADTFVLE